MANFKELFDSITLPIYASSFAMLKRGGNKFFSSPNDLIHARAFDNGSINFQMLIVVDKGIYLTLGEFLLRRPFVTEHSITLQKSIALQSLSHARTWMEHCSPMCQLPMTREAPEHEQKLSVLHVWLLQSIAAID
jgi:hypothetical protein